MANANPWQTANPFKGAKQSVEKKSTSVSLSKSKPLTTTPTAEPVKPMKMEAVKIRASIIRSLVKETVLNKYK